jgi:hypothetical protein
MTHRAGRKGWWLIPGGILLGLLLLNWEAISLGLAVASSESRPELLRDADWDEPGSARSFTRRFARGTPAADLTDWLTANGFTIDRASSSATKRVGGLPCNERIAIVWHAAPNGRLTAASATVSEAGCL